MAVIFGCSATISRPRPPKSCDTVEFHNDSAGEFRSARKIVRGRQDVAALLLGLQRHAPTPSSIKPIEVNGLPGLSLTWPEGMTDERQARRSIICIRLRHDTSEIERIYTMLAPRKLQAIDFGS